MEWSKIKNIIILILLGLNLFLLVMVVSQEYRSRQIDRASRNEALALLERNGITVDASLLPGDDTPPALTLEDGASAAGEALAHALLGEHVTQSASGVRATYSGSLGQMEAFSTGRFAVDFADGAFLLNGSSPESHAASLLARAGVEAEYLQQTSEEEGVLLLTFRQRWDSVPVFNAQITLSYSDGALRRMEGVLLPAGSGGTQQPQEAVTVATLLVRFLAQRNESGQMFSQLLSLTPGYHFSGTRPFSLTPAWYIVTDTGSYTLSALDGSLL